MSRVWSAFKSTSLVLVAGLQMMLCYTVALWAIGPLPLDTPCYVQSVSGESATLCKIDGGQRQLQFDLLREGKKVQSELSGPMALHAVRFSGLQPATAYTYMVRAAGVADAPEYRGSFRTAPADDRAAVRFTAVGDSGNLPWWYNFHKQGIGRVAHVLSWTHEPMQWEIARWIAAQDPHFFLHLGDIVYWPDLYDAYGEAFFRPFEPVLNKAPIYMLLGNHDLPTDGQSPPFERIFHHPDPGQVASPQRTYSFAFGSVRVVVFDVATSAWRSASMLGWLEKALADATEPWLIVAIHRPCFSVYRDEDPDLRDQLWPLLHKFGVDLVLSGDDHHYARFLPNPDPTSPIQVIAGGGGKKLYRLDEKDPRLVPGRSKSVWSFLSVEAKGLQLHCRAMSSSEAVIDGWTLDRRTGELGPGVQRGRRARILRLRR
ncbi:MAG: metallophosphoesterase [Planctomycetota bacterium]|nr:metallophosphoesterase [Planctomycetota bacterium]